MAGAPVRPMAPTFVEYVPVVSASVSVSPGLRKAYGTYWARAVERWGDRRIDQVNPSEIRTLITDVKVNRVQRRNVRGGRSAAEHVTADGLMTEVENPALKVAKPKRLASTRRALPDSRLSELYEVAVNSGDDPELDGLLIRLHVETACRRGGALGLRPVDLDAPTPRRSSWRIR